MDTFYGPGPAVGTKDTFKTKQTEIRAPTAGRTQKINNVKSVTCQVWGMISAQKKRQFRQRICDGGGMFDKGAGEGLPEKVTCGKGLEDIGKLSVGIWGGHSRQDRIAEALGWTLAWSIQEPLR